MARRIAITGASGFIGHHVVQSIRRNGWHPVALMRRHPGDLLDPAGELTIVLGDLSDRWALERLLAGADAIVHLAGVVKARNAAEFFEINERGTERLFAAAQALGVSAPIVHVSSLAAREPSLSPYAASKKAAEDHARRHGANRPVAILRPPAVYGPHDLELLPLFRMARLGLLVYPAAIGARFSAIHGADVASAIIALLRGEWPSGCCIEIDDGAQGGHDWTEVVAVLGRLAGKTLRAVRLPKSAMLPLAWGAQAIAQLTGRPAILSAAKLNELYHRDWVANSGRDPIAVHWRPAFNLETGFADSWAWYKSRKLLG